MTDFKGIEVSDVFGVSEPLSKLIDSVSKGIGKIYEPIHVKRMAKAKSEELQLISETVNDNICLPTTYIDGSITVDASDAEELMRRTGNRLFFQEMQKQQNIDSVVGYAYSELEQETEVSSEPVDADWILRFMNSVEDISNDEMQELWGKILAGEVKQPKTYTLRTLDTLRNISVFEARKFEEIAQFVLVVNGFHYIILNKDEINKEFGIRFEDIFLLEECGLISSQSLTLKLKTTNEVDILVKNPQVLGIIKGLKPDIQDVTLGIYKLSESGKQLYNAIDCKGNCDYTIKAMSSIKNSLDAENYTVTAHKIVEQIEGNEVIYSTEDLL